MATVVDEKCVLCSVIVINIYRERERYAHIYKCVIKEIFCLKNV